MSKITYRTAHIDGFEIFYREAGDVTPVSHPGETGVGV